MNRIRLVDLERQHGAIREELREALDSVVARGDFILGREVEAFEREFAEFCRVRWCVGVDSGTSAIELILRAIGANSEAEAILPAFTFVATASAAQSAGIRTILVDVSEETMTIDCEQAVSRINSRTKAIIPVHLYGYPAPVDDLIKAVAGRCLVVEDACQSHGARLAGGPVGSFGAAAAFSFYPSKNLGGLGDGGMVATNEERIASAVRSLRNYGQTERYIHDRPALNRRLDEIQAAALRVKLKRLESWNIQRRAAAALYRERLTGLNCAMPPAPREGEHCYYTFTIRSARRDALASFLRNRGIETGIHYPRPLHLLPAFADLGFKEGAFPVSERLAREVLSLPLFPGITEEEIGEVCSAIREFEESGKARSA